MNKNDVPYLAYGFLLGVSGVLLYSCTRSKNNAAPVNGQLLHYAVPYSSRHDKTASQLPLVAPRSKAVNPRQLVVHSRCQLLVA